MNSAAEHRSALAAALTGLMVVAQIGWPGPAWAQSGGALDPAFGAGGKVTTDFSRKADLVQGVAVQGDGKIVAVGWATVGGKYRFGLARYDDDGTLDSSFGTGGKVTTVFGGFEDTASAVAIYDETIPAYNGKIVVAGTTDSDGTGDYRFALARYNVDGTLDGSFGIGGKVTTSFSGSYCSAHALVIQPVDGKIVVAGFAASALAADEGKFLVARYDVDGFFDPDFGAGGSVETDFGGSFSNATSAALQTDGKIVVAGYSNAGSTHTQDFAVARYLSDGTPDPSFGQYNEGMVTTDFFASSDFGQSVAVDASGIVVAGQAYGTNGVRTFALLRYTFDGVLDPTFSGDGMVTSDFLGYGSFALAVVVDANNHIVAAGAAQAKRSRDIEFAVARFDNTGSPDTTFGTNGKVTTTFSGAADVASAVAQDLNGYIVAAGQTQDKNFALARYRP